MSATYATDACKTPLSDVGYAILASVVLLICLAVVIAINIYFELYPWQQ